MIAQSFAHIMRHISEENGKVRSEGIVLHLDRDFECDSRGEPVPHPLQSYEISKAPFRVFETVIMLLVLDLLLGIDLSSKKAIEERIMQELAIEESVTSS
jgi:hypothetical protein